MTLFRKSKDSIRDPGSAYLLVLGLGLALIIMGVTASVYSDRLDENERSRRLSALYECADSLRRYDMSERADDRFEAALGFRDAVLRLDCPDRIKEALCDYSGKLRYGSPDDPPPTELADEFSLLAATGGDVSELSGILGIGTADEAVSNSLPLRYLKAAAMRDAKLIVGDISGLPELVVGGRGLAMHASNLFIDFSGEDGRMREFFYLRTGGAPADIEELAGSLFDTSAKPETGLSKTLCGYSLVVSRTKREELRFVVDSEGRPVAILKVKR